MRIAQINMTTRGSTGKIMLQIAETARILGHEVHTYAPVEFSRIEKLPLLQAENHVTWGSTLESVVHYYGATLLGRNGLFSQRGTGKLIKDLKSFRPDVIHLHNLHGFCINLPMLFRYIKKENIRVIWTLHDCWAFTGHCPYFTMCGCDKWKTSCYQCPQHHIYPKSYTDDSKRMYRLKQKWFLGVKNMVLITPSEWLAGLVKQSFLKDYPVQVINNGIDLNTFRPTESDIRAKYSISDDKYMVLGVTFGWSKRKGLDVMIKLSEDLGKDYQIVLVGTTERLDAELPDNVISIHRTENQQELAQLYTCADIFVNPTREEVLGMTNIEALACGTPVITFRTGGSPETIDDTCGAVVECDDIEALLHMVRRVCTEKPYTKEACVLHAQGYDMNDKFKEYIRLYENCTHSSQSSLQ